MQNQSNDYIERRSVYDQSDKMKTIEGQYQQIQSQLLTLYKDRSVIKDLTKNLTHSFLFGCPYF